MKIVVLLGRVLFALIFLTSGFHHFTKETIEYAAKQGVPMASILVPISGIMALVGALSIMLGYKAKIGAWLLVLFLVPVTLTMHNWWQISDPIAQMTQHIMFNKNISMLGAALLLTYFGSGPLSVDAMMVARKQRNNH